MIIDSDRKLVRMLCEKGRMSWAELAGHLGVTPPAVADRARRLEERGVIVGYSARVDAAHVGWGLCAFVMVTLEHPRVRPAFIGFVLECVAIQECHHVAGEHDYLLKVRARSMGDLENTISNGIKAIPGVSRTVTTVVLASPKEAPVLLPAAL